jgi:streptomycin 6-kinase
MNIRIKDASIDDLNQINHVLRSSKSYWGYDQNFLDLFMEKLGMTEEYLKKHTIKLFYVNNQLAGFYNFLINDEGLFELDTFFLHPNSIGKGLGRKLWHMCCKTAKEQNKDEFIIWSDPHAENFYLKMGCEKIGVRQSPMMPDRYPPILRFKLPILCL